MRQGTCSMGLFHACDMDEKTDHGYRHDIQSCAALMVYIKDGLDSRFSNCGR